MGQRFMYRKSYSFYTVGRLSDLSEQGWDQFLNRGFRGNRISVNPWGASRGVCTLAEDHTEREHLTPDRLLLESGTWWDLTTIPVAFGVPRNRSDRACESCLVLPISGRSGSDPPA